MPHPSSSRVKAFFKQAAKTIDRLERDRLKSGNAEYLSDENLISLMNLIHTLLNSSSHSESMYLADPHNSRDLFLEIFCDYILQVNYINDLNSSYYYTSNTGGRDGKKKRLLFRSKLKKRSKYGQNKKTSHTSRIVSTMMTIATPPTIFDINLHAPQIPWHMSLLTDKTLLLLDKQQWHLLPTFIRDTLEWYLLNLYGPDRGRSAANRHTNTTNSGISSAGKSGKQGTINGFSLMNLRENQRRVILEEIVDWGYGVSVSPSSILSPSPHVPNNPSTSMIGGFNNANPSDLRGNVRVSIPVYTLLYLCNFVVSDKLDNFRSAVNAQFSSKKNRLSGDNNVHSDSHDNGSSMIIGENGIVHPVSSLITSSSNRRSGGASSMFDLNKVDSSALDGQSGWMTRLFSRQSNTLIRLLFAVFGHDNMIVHSMLDSLEDMVNLLFNPFHLFTGLIAFMFRFLFHVVFDIVCGIVQFFTALFSLVSPVNSNQNNSTENGGANTTDSSHNNKDGTQLSGEINDTGNQGNGGGVGGSSSISNRFGDSAILRLYLTNMITWLIFFDNELISQLRGGLNTIDFCILCLDGMFGTNLMDAVRRAKGLETLSGGASNRRNRSRDRKILGKGLYNLRQMRADEFAKSVRSGLIEPSRPLYHMLNGVVNLDAMRYSNSLSVPGLAAVVRQTIKKPLNSFINNNDDENNKDGSFSQSSAKMTESQLKAFELRMNKLVRTDTKYLMNELFHDLYQICLPIPRFYMCDSSGVSLKHPRRKKTRIIGHRYVAPPVAADADSDADSEDENKDSEDTLMTFAPKGFGNRINVPNNSDSVGEFFSLKLCEIINEVWISKLKSNSHNQIVSNLRVSMHLKCQMLGMIESFTRRLALRQYAYYLAYLGHCGFSQSGLNNTSTGVGGGRSSLKQGRYPHLFGYGKLPQQSCLSDELFNLLPDLFAMLNDCIRQWPLDFMHGNFECIIEILLNILCPWRVAMMESIKYDCAFVPTRKTKKKSWFDMLSNSFFSDVLAVGMGLRNNRGNKGSKTRLSDSPDTVGYGGMKYTRVRNDFISVNTFDFSVDGDDNGVGSGNQRKSGGKSRVTRKQLLFGKKKNTLFEILSDAVLGYDQDYLIRSARKMAHGGRGAAASSSSATNGDNIAREWTQYIVEVLPFYTALLNPCLQSMQYCDFRSESSRAALFQLLLLFGDTNIRRIVQRSEQLYFRHVNSKRHGSNGDMGGSEAHNLSGFSSLFESVTGSTSAENRSAKLNSEVTKQESLFVVESVNHVMFGDRRRATQKDTTLPPLLYTEKSVNMTRQLLSELMLPVYKCMKSETKELMNGHSSNLGWDQKMFDECFESYLWIEKIVENDFGITMSETRNSKQQGWFKTPGSFANPKTRRVVFQPLNVNGIRLSLSHATSTPVSSVMSSHSSIDENNRPMSNLTCFFDKSRKTSPYALNKRTRRLSEISTVSQKSNDVAGNDRSGLKNDSVLSGDQTNTKVKKIKDVWKQPPNEFELALMVDLLKWMDKTLLWPFYALMFGGDLVSDWSAYCQCSPLQVYNVRRLADMRWLIWIVLFGLSYFISWFLFSRFVLPLFILVQIAGRFVLRS